MEGTWLRRGGAALARGHGAGGAGVVAAGRAGAGAGSGARRGAAGRRARSSSPARASSAKAASTRRRPRPCSASEQIADLAIVNAGDIMELIPQNTAVVSDAVAGLTAGADVGAVLRQLARPQPDAGNAHADPGQHPPVHPDLRRRRGRPQPHSERDDRAGRDGHRRRLGGLRLGRGRRRGQHHPRHRPRGLRGPGRLRPDLPRRRRRLARLAGLRHRDRRPRAPRVRRRVRGASEGIGDCSEVRNWCAEGWDVYTNAHNIQPNGAPSGFNVARVAGLRPAQLRHGGRIRSRRSTSPAAWCATARPAAPAARN